MKKLQESQERTQAALKRKMEEHSIAMRKVTFLPRKDDGVSGGTLVTLTVTACECTIHR